MKLPLTAFLYGSASFHHGPEKPTNQDLRSSPRQEMTLMLRVPALTSGTHGPTVNSRSTPRLYVANSNDLSVGKDEVHVSDRCDPMSSLFPSPVLLEQGHVKVEPGAFIHYKSFGDPVASRKVLLRNDMRDSKDHLMEFIQHLLSRVQLESGEEKVLPDIHIVVLDNRGTGESYFGADEEERKASKVAVTMSSMAEETLKVMDHIGWTEASGMKVHTIGIRYRIHYALRMI